MRTSVFRNLDRSCGSLSHCKDGKWKLAAFTYFKLYKWICVVVFAEWSSFSHQVSTHTYLALERVFGLTTFILLWLVPNWPLLCKTCWEMYFSGQEEEWLWFALGVLFATSGFSPQAFTIGKDSPAPTIGVPPRTSLPDAPYWPLQLRCRLCRWSNFITFLKDFTFWIEY